MPARRLFPSCNALFLANVRLNKMIINIIKYSLTALITALVLAYLNKHANKKIKPSINGKFELRLNKFYWYTGLGSTLFGSIGFLLAILYLKNEESWIFGLLFLILFVGLGAICLLWYLNHKFKFDSKMIESISLYGKKETLKWDEIESIKFHTISSQLIFKNKEGVKVKAHRHLIGFGNLLNEIEDKTQWTINDLKIPNR